VELDGRTVSGGYRYGYQGSEKDNELKGDGNSYTTEFRQLDPRLGRWFSVDPMVIERTWLSGYNYVQNNPINKVDKTGALDDWILKDGVVSYDSRVLDQKDVETFYGKDAYYRPVGYEWTNQDGTHYELGEYGFFKKDGKVEFSVDKAESSLAFTDPVLNEVEIESEIAAIKENYSFSIGTFGFISTDMAAPDPSDAAIPKWLIYAVAGSLASYYVSKMDAEISEIYKKSGGPQGVQYSLKSMNTGIYDCYNCPSGTMELEMGSVWKYGETTNPTNRYSQAMLNNMGLVQINEFFGNQVQIKVMEKKKIYDYFLQTGHLPPGNKIFR
jgi:RHS repeat-associated protein